MSDRYRRARRHTSTQIGIGPNSPAPAPRPPKPWTPSRVKAEWATVRPKMEPKLHQAYDYQEGALTAIRSSLAAGNMRPMVMSPTGSGKTVIAEHAIAMQLLGKSLIRQAVEGKERVRVRRSAARTHQADRRSLSVCRPQRHRRRSRPP